MITTLDLSIPTQLTLALVPDLVLMGGAMLILLWAAWRPDSDEHQRRVGVASIILAGITMVLVLNWVGRFDAGPGPIAVDNFRWLVDVVILLGTVFAIALSMDDNMRSGVRSAESHVLVLLASSGMMLLAGARDLMIVFLGIELMSISVYALAGINRRSIRSAEGALKYFLLGAFATGFLLYGIALIYGSTGTTNLMLIAGSFTVHARSTLFLIGAGMLVIAFSFKVAAVPFHMWAPDVYEGAPTVVTGFMSTGAKAAAFGAFIAVFLRAFEFHGARMNEAVAFISAASMIVGNVIAVAQSNVKRMLAYSSIAHAGYMLAGVAAANPEGQTGILFYLAAYVVMNIGAFGVVGMVEGNESSKLTFDDYAGFSLQRPYIAALMSVFMFSLAGIPPFAGFFGKYYVFLAAVKGDMIWLAVVGVLTSLVSVYYYLRLVVYMYFREGKADLSASPGVPALVSLTVAALMVLQLGLFPGTVADLARSLF